MLFIVKSWYMNHLERASNSACNALVLALMGAGLMEPSPDSKVNEANMGPTWVLSAPDGPMLGQRTLLSGKLLSSILAVTTVTSLQLWFNWTSKIWCELKSAISDPLPKMKFNDATMEFLFDWIRPTETVSSSFNVPSLLQNTIDQITVTWHRLKYQQFECLLERLNKSWPKPPPPPL